jgi:hypothetical protein
VRAAVDAKVGAGAQTPEQRAAEAWVAHMRRGDFASAWTVSDALIRARGGRRCDHLPRHVQWVWDGTPVEGKRVLVRCYHGLGDTLQFIRYAPLLRAVASQVLVWVQPPLVLLLRTARGIDRIIPVHDGAVSAEYDVDVEVMELPHVFRTTLATVPREVPYLHVPPSRLASKDQLNVGLVWQAGDWDERRSIPVHLLRPLARVPGVTLHVLQRGAALADRPVGFGVDAGSDDVLAAARVMRALDAVVTVDSMPAHLAGALGVPTFTLLHAAPDWRWMEHREDTPWYPTMRLFRQPTPGDWPSVVARVADELRRMAASRERESAA